MFAVVGDKLKSNWILLNHAVTPAVLLRVSVSDFVIDDREKENVDVGESAGTIQPWTKAPDGSCVFECCLNLKA